MNDSRNMISDGIPFGNPYCSDWLQYQEIDKWFDDPASPVSSDNISNQVVSLPNSLKTLCFCLNILAWKLVWFWVSCWFHMAQQVLCWRTSLQVIGPWFGAEPVIVIVTVWTRRWQDLLSSVFVYYLAITGIIFFAIIVIIILHLLSLSLSKSAEILILFICSIINFGFILGQ